MTTSSWLEKLWTARPASAVERLPLHALRAHMRHALADCEGPAARRLCGRIEDADGAQDLWLMRGDVFQLVAARHCEAEAQRRVNALLPAFEGAVPRRLLTPV